ncbi:cytoplasmic protein [Halobacillus halophilus]|uniref:Cytoplasmic protein n=1 Tax=Halobacillus halophilus (strain ATCC 35676 / DSM 2266 / JCM 20832 / KCTC 3685 / LMG 17431 / NBRC 102448 / NCIMB 2269) TaxID=866895 RepID=I0JKZ1_HALH3|nr:DUF1456 family protein [Halobacillus halophilus]ASF38934.1 cytoplasmic protein [Halobacillus halophilus]CCG44811.1 hypothetical protein HBHAL_2468 [Halobacillus halophilus DSM 2266]
MDNNDIVIRLRYALDIKDQDMAEIFRLGGENLTTEEVGKVLTKLEDIDEEEENEDYIKCTNSMLESFLNGLITFKRGPQEPKPGQPNKPDRSIKNQSSVNNVMLKKVKIALKLTAEDIIDILDEVNVKITKGEVSALLRKEGHKNYRQFGDQYARNFLQGLTIRYRG